MGVKVSPFIDPDRPDRFDPRAPEVSFEAFKSSFRRYHGDEIGLGVAVDVIIAEFVRRYISNAPSIADELNQAKMWDVREIARTLELDLHDEETFSDITTMLESYGYLSFDSPPVEIAEPYAFAYLDPAGLERGAAVLGRFFGWENVAPASDRVVTIDHNSSEFAEIRARLDEITELVRSDNTGAVGSAEENERLREQISSGKRLLSIRNVSLAAVSATVIAALKYLANAFADEGIGRLAAALIDAITQALGI